MPTLDATTTLAFTASGISASNLYGWLQNLFSYGINSALWVVQAFWPFIIVVLILVVFFKVAGRALHLFK